MLLCHKRYVASKLSSISGLGRSPGEGKGYPLQYSGLENSMDCVVHGIATSWTRLSNFNFDFVGLRCCSGFSLVIASGAYSLIAVASLVAEHRFWDPPASALGARGLSSCSFWAPEHRLMDVARELSCSMICGILARQWGIEPESSALQGRFLATEPLGKSPHVHFYIVICLGLGLPW